VTDVRRAALAIALLVVAVCTTGYALLHGSLATVEGQQSLAGLDAAVEVTRDHLGVVTIRSRGRIDAARALGFVHAQDRFFQMDLMRRDAAGELAALVGPSALEHDRTRRVHGLRAVARQVVSQLGEPERGILTAYTEGVNAGLGGLSVRPFEYLLLRGEPAPWRPEDSILCILAMYFQLNDVDAVRDRTLARLHDALPPSVFRFLAVSGTHWDAPVLGAAAPEVPVPSPRACNLRDASLPRRGHTLPPDVEDDVVVGSNGWAVAASHSATGKAILADDMHLALRVPNIWYRVRQIVDDAALPGPGADVTGATLPGLPIVVVGSNGHVAWGFTNSRGDWADLVLLDLEPGESLRYRTPDGFQAFGQRRERITVRGAEPVELRVRTTIWGPLVGEDHRGRPLALRWLAHLPEATNLTLRRLEEAGDVRAAMDVAHTAGVPPQNFMVADTDGNIGWTIAGRIPARVGYDPRIPASWADGQRGWQGWLPAQDYPEIVNPPEGRIWTANARVVDGAMLERIGDGGYSLGARAGQIRDGLLSRDRATIADMLAIQLDDRSRLKQRWAQLMLQSLGPKTADTDPRRAVLRRALRRWNGRSSVDSVAHRLVHTFRLWVHHEILSALTAGCGGEEIPLPDRRMYQLEGPVWQLLQARPGHLLPPRYERWSELLDAGIDAALASCAGEALEACTWGKLNTVNIAHPLTRALPVLGAWLDIHDGPLPGDAHAPRVQRVSSGASQRMAVSPGDEGSGYFHMPGGQSGHPLSPFYRAGHEAWVNGEATSFLPGPVQHSLTLRP
jgi:penicillin amidase